MIDSFPNFLSAAATGDLALLKRSAPAQSPFLNRGNTDGSRAIHLAAARGYVDCCEHLHSQGALLNVTDAMQRTPLHAAAHSGRLDAATFLIQNGAILDSIDKVPFPFVTFSTSSSGNPPVPRVRVRP
jgi:ankyrin repeat protein